MYSYDSFQRIIVNTVYACLCKLFNSLVKKCRCPPVVLFSLADSVGRARRKHVRWERETDIG